MPPFYHAVDGLVKPRAGLIDLLRAPPCPRLRNVTHVSGNRIEMLRATLDIPLDLTMIASRTSR